MAYTESTRTEVGAKFSEAARLLWKFLRENNLSRTQFAKKADVSRSALHRWLYGDRLPDLAETKAIHKVAGIDPMLWLQKPRTPFTVPANRPSPS